MRLNKITFRLCIWLYTILLDIILIVLVSKYITFLINDYMVFKSMVITLLIGRVIIIEYKSYGRKDINTRYSGRIINTGDLIDEIISATFNKFVFAIKATIILSCLYLTRYI